MDSWKKSVQDFLVSRMMMMISPASWRVYKSSEYSRESSQEIRSFLLESKALSRITIIDRGFAKKKKELREKVFRDVVDIYIIDSCRRADAVVKI
jgi:hypothetical protein